MSEDDKRMATAATATAPNIEGAAEEASMLRDKIIFTLEVYPFLARSMLHQAIGTAVSRRFWDPILQSLIEEGLICQTTLSAKTPLNRNQTFVIYHLKGRSYEDLQTDNIRIAHEGSKPQPTIVNA